MQPLRRPSRNVQVFDSGGAVIAGMFLSSITLLLGLRDVCRGLAIWHSPMG